MRTVYFRRLAGLTSFMSNLWRSHELSMGPVGAFDFSSMWVSVNLDDVEEDRQRNGNESSAHRDTVHDREPAQRALPVGPVDPDRLHQAPHPVRQMQAQAAHGDDVGRDHRE